MIMKKGKSLLGKTKTYDIEAGKPQRRTFQQGVDSDTGQKLGTLSELNRFTHGSWANLGATRMQKALIRNNQSQLPYF